jgi:hypothetical protein
MTQILKLAAAVLIAAIAAGCAAPDKKMDWKGLSDYLDKQEQGE